MLVSLLLAASISIAQSDREAEARGYYFAAENSYEDGNYQRSLGLLDDARRALGGSNPTLSSLRVKVLFMQEQYKEAKSEVTRFFGYDNASDRMLEEMAEYLVDIDALLDAEQERDRVTNELVSQWQNAGGQPNTFTELWQDIYPNPGFDQFSNFGVFSENGGGELVLQLYANDNNPNQDSQNKSVRYSSDGEVTTRQTPLPGQFMRYIFDGVDGALAFGSYKTENETATMLYRLGKSAIRRSSEIAASYGINVVSPNVLGFNNNGQPGFFISGAGYVNRQRATFVGILDSNLNLLNHTRGDSYEKEDITALHQSEDGSFLWIGRAGETYNQAYPAIFKYTANMSLQWNKRFTGMGYGSNFEISDAHGGGYVTTGYVNDGAEGSLSKSVITKYNANGSVAWSTVLGSNGNLWARNIIRTETGYLLGVETQNGQESDLALAGIDRNGNLQWQKTWEKSGAQGPRKIVQSTDGDYFLAYYDRSIPDQGDLGVIKFTLKTAEQRMEESAEIQGERFSEYTEFESSRRTDLAFMPQKLKLLRELNAAMVMIPTGSYASGTPEREIQIDEFMMQKHELTIAQWNVCAEAGVCKRITPFVSGPDDRLPVTMVSYTEISQYIQWLNAGTGQGFRLPSETEWEYAARAGATSNYPWGRRMGNGNANCSNCRGSQDSIMPIMSFDPNAWGLYDVSGNVSEFVYDCYHPGSTSGAPTSERPWMSSNNGDCQRGITRGGNFINDRDGVTLRIRYRASKTQTYRGTGFRLARVNKPKWTLSTTPGVEGGYWTMGDTLGNGTFAFYYSDNSYHVIDSEAFDLSSFSNPELIFNHSYRMEDLIDHDTSTDPLYQMFDGWDGINVRISTDNGVTWEVLRDPVPAYNSKSLWSFGGIHHEGLNVPGWGEKSAGTSEPVVFDLSDYTNETVKFRFAFASDAHTSGWSDARVLGSWQLNNIAIRDSSNNTDITNRFSSSFYRE